MGTWVVKREEEEAAEAEEAEEVEEIVRDSFFVEVVVWGDGRVLRSTWTRYYALR